MRQSSDDEKVDIKTHEKFYHLREIRKTFNWKTDIIFNGYKRGSKKQKIKTYTNLKNNKIVC